MIGEKRTEIPHEGIVRWPNRGNSPIVAVYRPNSLCWLVSGEDKAYGSSEELENTYGTEWEIVKEVR